MLLTHIREVPYSNLGRNTGCPLVKKLTNGKNAKLHVFMKLTMFENRALRTIFGPKRDEVTGGWKKKLHN
jgi:hypothetical protein